VDRERIEIENEILEKLKGKIYLTQPYDKRKETIFEAFLEVYNSERCKRFISRVGGLELETFFKEFLSYGMIEEFLQDPEVEDIMINSLSPIYIHKTFQGLVRTDKRFESRDELELFIKKLVIFSGRDNVRKINNIELSEIKGRVNIIYSPFGPQITITRAKEKPLSIIHLIENRTLNAQIAGQLWLYVEGLGIRPANILISGGPGSGKTTLLNALFSFIPESERLVVIEDTLELNTDYEGNCSRLESDEELTLADLVKNSLRMRPDRIIIGEVRGKEAQDMMTAMNIGKYCMGTLHASTARETIMRLENEPMNVPEVLLNLIDVIIIMKRYNIKGEVFRALGEIVETAGIERKMVLLSQLWSYDPIKREFRETMVSSVYRDKLAQMSGRTSKEIINEINLRAKLLNILLERNIKDIAEVSKFCRSFNKDPRGTVKQLGLDYEKLLEG